MPGLDGRYGKGGAATSLRGTAGPAFAVLACLALAFGLGDRALMDPDEGRNASIAWEMTRNGDYLLPRLNGLPFLDKPFLFFAAEAAAMHMLGPGELAPRLPSLLATWATVALAGWFALRLFGRPAGWMAALACATAPYTIAFSGIAIFDALLGFFVVLAMVGFYLAVEQPSASTSGSQLGKKACALAWMAMAMGVMTKGPVAVALPLLVGTAYAVCRRRASAIWAPAGLICFCAVVLPWLWILEQKHPGFLRYALVTETWTRLTSDELRRTGPLWYFVIPLLAGTLPWSLFAIKAALRRSTAADDSAGHDGARPRLFLLLWVLLPFVLFSFSQSKRLQYLVPLVPAVALLAASGITRDAAPFRIFRGAACLWLLFGLILVAAGAGAFPITLRSQPELVDVARSFAVSFGVVAGTAGALVWLLARRARWAALGLATPLVLLPLLAHPLISEVAQGRSAREPAASMVSADGGRFRVIAIDALPLSLIYYLQQTVELSSATSHPLTSNSILHFHPTATEQTAPTLRDATWWRSVLTSSRDPLFFALSPTNMPARSDLESAGLPLVFSHRKLVIYGPTNPGTEASNRLSP